MAIPADGLYIIRTAMNKEFVWDVNGDTSANRANLQIYTKNGGLNGGGNHQRFYLQSSGSASNEKNFFVANYGKAVEIYGKTKATGLKKGDNVSQFDWNGSICQFWTIEETKAYNGSVAYFVKSVINQSFVMDVSNAVYKNGQNIMMHPKHTTTAVEAHGDNQKWFFEKTARLEPKWPVPSGVGVVLNQNEKSSRSWISMTAGQTSYLLASFTCSGGASNFQIRCRIRYRKLGTNNWGAWEAWRVFDRVVNENDDGWGNVWASNTQVNASGSFKKVAQSYYIPFNVLNNSTNGTYIGYVGDGSIIYGDRAQMQIEVRRFANVTVKGISMPSVGNAASATVNITIMPTLSIDGFAFTMDGLKIGYQGDMHRGDNKLVVGIMTGANGKKLTRRPFTFGGIHWDGTVTIPLSELCYIPDPNEQIKFTTDWTQTDNKRTQSWTRPVSYDAAHGLTIDAIFAPGDGATILATPVATYVNDEMHIIYEQDGETLIAQCEKVDGKFVLIPPLGKKYQVMYSAGSGDKWGVRSWKGIVVEGEGQMFNFGNTYFRLFLQEKAYGEENMSYTANASSYSFMGDRRETVYFGEGGTVSQNISGMCPIDIEKNVPGAVWPDKCSLDDFHALRNAKYAVYRDLYGRRYDIAVMSTTEKPYMDNIFSVTLTLKERMATN